MPSPTPRAIEVRQPRAVIFIAFSAAPLRAAGHSVFPSAVVHSDIDAVAFPNQTLRDLVARSRFVGLRSLESSSKNKEVHRP